MASIVYETEGVGTRVMVRVVKLIFSVQYYTFSINLLAFYHECPSLIDYATHYLFKVHMTDFFYLLD